MVGGPFRWLTGLVNRFRLGTAVAVVGSPRASVRRVGLSVAVLAGFLALSGIASTSAQPSSVRQLGPRPSPVNSVCGGVVVRPHVVTLFQKITAHATGPQTCYGSVNAWSWGYSTYTPDRGGIFTVVGGCKTMQNTCVLKAKRTQTTWNTICIGGNVASRPGGSGWEACDYYAVLRGRWCVVPNLENMPFGKTKQALRQSGCRFGRVLRGSGRYVYYQSAPAGSIHRHGFRVNVTLIPVPVNPPP